MSAAPPMFARPVHTRLRVRDAQLNVLDGHPATVTGTLAPGLPGKTVTLQRLGNHGWRTLTRTLTGLRGRFKLRYLPWQTGTELVRLRFAGDARDLAAHRFLGRLNVYHLAGASWYGGGGQTACGASLTSSTQGVANKTLPCGTLVTLRYGGRTIRVPVIDRGPYVEGREFDLTEATKQALGFGDTGQVWSTN
ncbi:MAG TPA: RlpA-like double-psi beta-barrel domain-containing protein [Solirubrobacteraceae bacterium]|nr:RlpA-like double-psi beta-barrel domain-containing protein [Solirubrobacteraceae bacterium]